MGIRSTNPTQSFSDEQNVRSVGNAFSAFTDIFSKTGNDAVSAPHPGGPAIATGGVKFKVPTAAAPVPTGGGYVYHFFTDTSTPAPFELTYGDSVNVLLIAGGGRGSRAGGGGGGIAHVTSLPTGIPLGGSGNPFTATISVGEGKSPTSGSTNRGDDSTFVCAPPADPSTPITIKALGGGNGGGGNGNNGGSGGGGGWPGDAPGFSSPGASGGSSLQQNQNPGFAAAFPNATLTPYGNPGGPTIPGHPSSDGTGRGGGGAGEDSPGSFGQGGAGQPFAIVPGPVLYPYMPSPLQTTLGTAWRDALGPTGLMGGGGGGGTAFAYGTVPSDAERQRIGGPGGGGKGGFQDPPNFAGPDNPAEPGVNYTGGGGGGFGTSNPIGNGGHGIVIVYYYEG